MHKNFTKTKEIDDIEFTTRVFAAKKAFKLKAKIIATISPSLGHLLENLGSNTKTEDFNLLDMDIKGESISKAAEMLFKKLSPENLLDLTTDIFAETLVKIEDIEKLQKLNSDIGFDGAFRQNTMRIYKVAWWVLQVNYPDILDTSDFLGMVRGNGGNQI